MTVEYRRPTVIVWALWLSVMNGVGGVMFSTVWPDLEDRGTVLPVSIVVAALLIAAAWFLYSGNSWGAVATVIVNALNILLAIPGTFRPTPGFIVGGTITIVLSALTIWFALNPDARAFWGGASRTIG